MACAGCRRRRAKIKNFVRKLAAPEARAEEPTPPEKKAKKQITQKSRRVIKKKVTPRKTMKARIYRGKGK